MKKKPRWKSTNRRKTSKPKKPAIQPNDLSEMLELGKIIADAPKIREGFAKKFRENPTDELKLALAEFDDALEVGKRRFSKMAAAEFRRHLLLLEESLIETIENTDDEEFLRLGEESEARRNVQDFIKRRPATIKSLSTMHPDDGLKVLAILNKIISDVQNRLKVKRDQAEKRFPHLRKEYETDDHYKKAMADLLGAIAARDDVAQAVKFVPPEKRAEGIRLAARMTKKIEQAEQALANEYEALQKKGRAVDDMRQLLKSYSSEELAEVREHFRKNPGTMEHIEELLAKEFPE